MKTLSLSCSLSRAQFLSTLMKLQLSPNHALHLHIGYVDHYNLLAVLLLELLVLGTVSAGTEICSLPIKQS